MKNTDAENRRLREQFAAAALTGLLAAIGKEHAEHEKAWVAVSAWEYADAMMESTGK